MKSFYEFYQKMLREQVPAPAGQNQQPAAQNPAQQPQQQAKPANTAQAGQGTSPPIPDKATQAIMDTLKANAGKVADPKMKKTFTDLLANMEKPKPGAPQQQPQQGQQPAPPAAGPTASPAAAATAASSTSKVVLRS
jgi:hypothetical protein